MQTEPEEYTPYRQSNSAKVASGLVLPGVPLATIALDAINYFTGGTVLTWLLIFFLYVGAGAVGARVFGRKDRLYCAVFGLVVGVALSFVAIVVKVILAMALGIPSAGLIAGLLDAVKRLATLLGLSSELVNLLGALPYFCVCGPVQCSLGGLVAGLGGLIYGLRHTAGVATDSGPNES